MIIPTNLSGRQMKALKLIEDLNGKAILDIGCSYGWFEEHATRGNPKRIVGIEPNAKDFEYARKKHKDVEFVEASVLELPFESNTFDIVIMFEVIEHIPPNTEPKAIREINRVLKKGGTFYLSTPQNHIVNNLLDPIWYIGHRHYSITQIRELLENNGFSVKWIKVSGGLISLIYMILFYLFKHIFRKDMLLMQKWFDRKRITEYKDDNGFVTLFFKNDKVR